MSLASRPPTHPGARVTRHCFTALVIVDRQGREHPPYRVSALSAAPAYSSAARQQYQAATDR